MEDNETSATYNSDIDSLFDYPINSFYEVYEPDLYLGNGRRKGWRLFLETMNDFNFEMLERCEELEDMDKYFSNN